MPTRVWRSSGVIPSLKLEDVSDYIVDASTGASTASTLAMSEEKWDELSEEHQKIIREVSTTVPQLYVEQNLKTEEASCKATRAADVELSVLDGAEVEKLRAAGEKIVVDQWLAEVKKAATTARRSARSMTPRSRPPQPNSATPT